MTQEMWQNGCCIFIGIITTLGIIWITCIQPKISNYLECKRDGCWHEWRLESGVRYYCKKCNKHGGFIPFY